MGLKTTVQLGGVTVIIACLPIVSQCSLVLRYIY